MYNGIPSGNHAAYNTGCISGNRYNPNITSSEYMGPTSMTLPQHYHMSPVARPQPQEISQEMHQSNQNNIPFSSQG